MQRAGRLALALVLVLSSCAASQSRNLPVAGGGSVADLDRESTSLSFDTGSPAGAPNTIGAVDMEPSRPPVARYWLLPSDRRLLAGPLDAALSLDPARVRLVQRLLTLRGYFRGPINGLLDPALVDALSRCQADAGLPITGRLDAATAKLLGIALPLPARHG